MEIRGISLKEVERIVRWVSVNVYDGNLILHGDARDLPRRGGGMRGRLAVTDSQGPGSRLSRSGRRHGPYACWHAYRDALSALFAAYPDAVIITMMARYDGERGFYDTYPGTGRQNVGSMMFPQSMPDLCECFPDEYVRPEPVGEYEVESLGIVPTSAFPHHLDAAWGPPPGGA